MKKTNLGLFVPIIALAACVTGPKLDITQPPIDMTFQTKHATRNVDRLDLIEVRTILNRQGNWQEIGPTLCTAYGRGFEATFKTPAILRVPVYYGSTSPLRIQCKTDIDSKPRVSGKTVDAENLSAPKDEGIGITTGSGGTEVNAVIGIRNRNKDRFNYPSRVTVTFAP